MDNAPTLSCRPTLTLVGPGYVAHELEARTEEREDEAIVEISVTQVKLILAEVARKYPELEGAMEIAKRMLVTLDTVRDEASFKASLVLNEATIDPNQTLKNIISMCAPRTLKFHFDGREVSHG